MKKRIVKVVALMTMVMLSVNSLYVPVSAATINLVWGFEDPDKTLDVPELGLLYNGFMHDGSGKGEIQTAVKYSGKYAMKTNAAGLAWGLVWKVKLEKSKEYVFSAMIKAENFTNPQEYNLFARVTSPVEIHLADMKMLEEGTYNWMKYEIAFKAVNDAVVEMGIQPFVGGPAMSGTLYFDDLRVKEKGAPDITQAPPVVATPTSDAKPTVTTAPASSTTVSKDVTGTPTSSDTESIDESIDESVDEVSDVDETSDEESSEEYVSEISEEETSKTESSTKDDEKKSSPWIWIVIVAAIAAIAGGVAIIINKKKKIID